MRVLVWQWGRRGGGPRFAASLAEAFRLEPQNNVTLSLSSSAELLNSPTFPACEMPVETYANAIGLVRKLVSAPYEISRLVGRLAPLQLDLAICAMPGPLDPLMMAALRRLKIPTAVVVHDADTHPGDYIPLLRGLQRHMIRRANAVITLSEFVAERLRVQGQVSDETKLFTLPHPAFKFSSLPLQPPRAHGGPWRLLAFGRLRRYKGLDLLASALARKGIIAEIELRVIGAGPENATLAALRALPGVTVENRWVPEHEVGALLAWSDAVVLPYREASQSGVAPTALAAGRYILASNVGGLGEQLYGHPRAILCHPSVVGLEAGLNQLLRINPEEAAPTECLETAWFETVNSFLHQFAGPGVNRVDTLSSDKSNAEVIVAGGGFTSKRQRALTKCG